MEGFYCRSLVKTLWLQHCGYNFAATRVTFHKVPTGGTALGEIRFPLYFDVPSVCQQ